MITKDPVDILPLDIPEPVSEIRMMLLSQSISAPTCLRRRSWEQGIYQATFVSENDIDSCADLCSVAVHVDGLEYALAGRLPAVQAAWV